jgi:glutathione synthase/RimK-type ligase-like ATP-grasp enzyme
VLADAPAAARHAPCHAGVFYGYDFHLTPQGPKLIEINTNAGGGLLTTRHFGHNDVEQAYIGMFRTECPVLKTLAVVDETPAQQYLYPEFLLFQELFAHHGISACICAPQDLAFHQDELWQGTTRLDLVYNRLTDFFLAAEHNTALRQACLHNTTVITPHPHHYALYADKRNMALLADDALLASWNVDQETRRVLAGTVPRTELARADKAEDFWARRKGLFFKPATGYGARAAYRGDKITRRVFEAALAADTIAQELVPPSIIEAEVDGVLTGLKADIRCYVYRGEIQFVAARLWQGQTTNFRTPGGGFAEVVVA